MAQSPPEPTPSEALDLVEERAPQLLALGATEIVIGPVVVRFASPAAPAPASSSGREPDDAGDAGDRRETAAPEPRNALEDPVTFGFKPGAKVPRLRRRSPVDVDDDADPKP